MCFLRLNYDFIVYINFNYAYLSENFQFIQVYKHYNVCFIS